MNSPSLAAPNAPPRRAIPQSASETFWTAPDGWRVRRIDWPGPSQGCRGSILFMPGRGDCYEKYLETLDGWHRQGWHVTAADWRGQAGSGRLGADATTGHVDDFSTWVGDLAQFWAEWKAAAPGPHVLAAHSMGGHIVLRALAERRVDPDAAVLSAPMLGFLPQFMPSWLLYAFASLRLKFSEPHTPAWKISEKPGARLKERMLLLTHDADRYEDEIWWKVQRPELVMGPGSWGWTERALASIKAQDKAGVLEAVQVPVLIVATDNDRLVSFAAIARAAKRLKHGELFRFGAECRHELLREIDPIRKQALSVIDAFLTVHAPAPDGAAISE